MGFRQAAKRAEPGLAGSVPGGRVAFANLTKQARGVGYRSGQSFDHLPIVLVPCHRRNSLPVLVPRICWEPHLLEEQANG